MKAWLLICRILTKAAVACLAEISEASVLPLHLPACAGFFVKPLVEGVAGMTWFKSHPRQYSLNTEIG